MKLSLFSALLALVMLGGCSTMQVSTDRDPQFDTSNLKRFSVLVKESQKTDALTNTHISRAITARLEQMGYIPAPKEQADFYLLFLLDVQDKTEVQTVYESWGIEPYPYNLRNRNYIPQYPYYIDPFNVNPTVGTTTTQTYEYQEGTLIVDAVDTGNQRLFWRGTVKDELQGFDNAKEKITYIDKVIENLFETFPAQAGR